jgi:hypothetical protein
VTKRLEFRGLTDQDIPPKPGYFRVIAVVAPRMPQVFLDKLFVLYYPEVLFNEADIWEVEASGKLYFDIKLSEFPEEHRCICVSRSDICLHMGQGPADYLLARELGSELERQCCGAKGQPSAPLNRSYLNRHRQQDLWDGNGGPQSQWSKTGKESTGKRTKFKSWHNPKIADSRFLHWKV